MYLYFAILNDLSFISYKIKAGRLLFNGGGWADKGMIFLQL